MNCLNKYQCKGCEKTFSESQVYRYGKEKEPFCENCKKNIKNCSWCQKNVSFSEYGNYPCHSASSRKLNNDGTEEKEYNIFCDDRCQSEFEAFEENAPKKVAERQKRQELIDKGYKPCGRNLIPFEPLKIDCNNLIPPSEKYCENCQKLEKEREENIKKRQLENEQAWAENEKKVKKAQDWWNSLSKEEKLAEIKKIEQEWIKKAGGDDFHGYMGEGNDISGSSIEFKNGSLYVYPEDLSKIPPPLLEKFGINLTPEHSKNYFPSGGFHSDNLQKQINNLESKLQIAKKNGKQSEINKLEQELKQLKSQTKENSTNEKSPLKYWIIGISLISVLVLGIIIILKAQGKKNTKIKLNNKNIK